MLWAVGSQAGTTPPSRVTGRQRGGERRREASMVREEASAGSTGLWEGRLGSGAGRGQGCGGCGWVGAFLAEGLAWGKVWGMKRARGCGEGDGTGDRARAT